MVKRILRSIGVGVALTGFIGGFIALSLSAFNSSATSQSGDQDLVRVIRDVSPWSYIVGVMIFVTGFLVGYRYFSKRQARQEASR